MAEIWINMSQAWRSAFQTKLSIVVAILGILAGWQANSYWNFLQSDIRNSKQIVASLLEIHKFYNENNNFVPDFAADQRKQFSEILKEKLNLSLKLSNFDRLEFSYLGGQINIAKEKLTASLLFRDHEETISLHIVPALKHHLDKILDESASKYTLAMQSKLGYHLIVVGTTTAELNIRLSALIDISSGGKNERERASILN